jgi:acyl-CoA synthetase (AMP-forming)/AMP-acid ligase II
VVQAAVLGIPDATHGQRVVGFVKLAKGAQRCGMNDIREAVRVRLAAYKVPEWVAVLPEFPLTRLGKLDRKILAIIARWRDVDGPYERPSMWRSSAKMNR